MLFGRSPQSSVSRRTWARRSRILALAALGVTAKARALTLDPLYLSSVTSLTNASTIENAVQYVCQQYDSLLTAPVTIEFDVAAASGTSFLGESQTSLVENGSSPFTYSQIRSALNANATTASDTTAVNSLPTNNPTPTNAYLIPQAEAQALGFASEALAGTFTFSTSFTYTYSPTNRAVAGEADFIGVAEHEITEIMGRNEELGSNDGAGSAYMPYDLFRWTAPNVRTVSSTATNAYFSINSGTTYLKGFNPAGNGGDLQDWLSGTNDSYNAFSATGVENDLSPTDITAMDILGYEASTTARTLTWDGSSNSYDCSHWLLNSSAWTVYIGAAQTITSGTVTYTPPIPSQNLVLSSTSIDGTGLTISGGNVRVQTLSGQTNGPNGCGLVLGTGGSVAISGSGQLNLAGLLSVGTSSGDNTSVTVSGGQLNVGLSRTNSVGVDPTLYCGVAGDGTVTQTNTATVSTYNLDLASAASGMGIYNMNGGTLTVGNDLCVAGNTNAAGGLGVLNISAGTTTVSNALLIYDVADASLSMTGGRLTAGSTVNSLPTTHISGGTATLGAITGTGSLTVGANSGISASVSATTLTQASLTIENTGLVTLTGSGVSTVSSLSISGDGTLDLTTGALVVDYTSTSPESQIRNWISNGYNGALWNGDGIDSSVAHNDAVNYQESPYKGNAAIGYGDNSDLGRTDIPAKSVLVRFTLYGDADLNGIVDLNDFDDWLYGYTGGKDSAGGISWATGDFNYDGIVDLNDFDLWLSGYTSGVGSVGTLDHAIDVSTLSSAQKTELLDIVSSVPEPASVGLLSMAGLAFWPRRWLVRRRRVR